MMDVKQEEKEEGWRAPDYLQERTGHTRRSFSHSMTLNSDTPTQAKADRLPLPECSEILPRLRKQRCSAAPLTPD